jgi:uncharacterized protein YndB with AHSA1/START domain/DNA-binding transcriptional ArsR family regulator
MPTEVTLEGVRSERPDEAAVFRALADGSRRELLDRLRERDGQSLSDLVEHLPMTRFGVMKHLRVLEGAGLVVTRRRGREKQHFLNPVPIRALQERWIAKYLEPWVAAMTGLKAELEGFERAGSEVAAGAAEGEQMSDTASTASATTSETDAAATGPASGEHVLEVYIRATLEAVWRGITDGAMTRRYFHETTINSTWTVGARVEYLFDDGRVAVEGEVLECDQPRRLSYTWHVLYNDEAALEAPSRVSWELEPLGESVRLRMTHDRFPAASIVFPEISQGWAPLLSSLKSLIETGAPLQFAGPESETTADGGG